MSPTTKEEIKRHHENGIRAYMMQQKAKGREACALGVPAEANPHEKGSDEAILWLDGWTQQKGAERVQESSERPH